MPAADSCASQYPGVASPRPTAYVSAGQLTAQISAADVATAGPVMVTVVNPSPGGGVSNAKTLKVK